MEIKISTHFFFVFGFFFLASSIAFAKFMEHVDKNIMSFCNTLYGCSFTYNEKANPKITHIFKMPKMYFEINSYRNKMNLKGTEDEIVPVI